MDQNNCKRRNTEDLSNSRDCGTTRKRSKEQGTKETAINDYIDEYFEKLQYLQQNQRGDVSGMMNSELVRNIISKFNKIFQLWDENPYFQRSLDRSVFENIHKNMSNIFNTNEHDTTATGGDVLFTLKCKLCRKTFPLRNKDCSYSYDCHEISHRIDFLENDPTETAAMRLYDSVFMYARCYLCSEEIQLENLIEGKDDPIAQHLKSTSHRNKSKLFQNNQHHIEDLCWKNNVFKCLICKKQYFVDEFAKHFKSDHVISKTNDVDVEDVDVDMEKMCI